MDETVASRLLAFIERTTDFVGVTDDSGNVVYVNEATRRRLGLDPADPVELTTADLFPQSAFERYFEEVRPAILESGSWNGVIPVRVAGDATADAWLTVVGEGLPGGDVGWLVTVGRDVTDWVHDRDQLSWQATHDELTGVARRVVLGERLERALARARRNGDWVGVVFMDINRFKAINDGFGHEAGDQVLAQIGARLRVATREVDTVVRVGGDEFVVLIDGLTERSDAERFAERLRADLTGRPFEVGPASIDADVSLGLVLGDGRTDPGRLLREADLAMYESKGRPGSPIVARWVGEAPDRGSQTTQSVAVALTQQLINPHYQPVVDLLSGQLVGYQALARWGTDPTADFLDRVQDTGVGVALDLAVLRRATSDAAGWDPAAALRLYAHISTRLLVDPNVALRMTEVLVRAGLAPEVLFLQVPASALVADEAVEGLRSLSDLGVRLVAAHVQPPSGPDRVDGLLDGWLMDRSATERPSDEQVAGGIRSVVAAAARAGVEVAVTGVETEADREQLVALGCRLGAGYLFGRPSAAA